MVVSTLFIGTEIDECPDTRTKPQICRTKAEEAIILEYTVIVVSDGSLLGSITFVSFEEL